LITVLVVAEPGAAETLDRAAAREPSLELLHAGDAEQAHHRVSRNRRFDAVVPHPPPDRAAHPAALLREEDPSGPPLFAPALPEPPRPVRPLTASTPAELQNAVTRELSG
jgi:hypothetical protein